MCIPLGGKAIGWLFFVCLFVCFFFLALQEYQDLSICAFVLFVRVMGARLLRVSLVERKCSLKIHWNRCGLTFWS
jgi:hypothetical protein